MSTIAVPRAVRPVMLLVTEPEVLTHVAEVVRLPSGPRRSKHASFQAPVVSGHVLKFWRPIWLPIPRGPATYAWNAIDLYVAALGRLNCHPPAPGPRGQTACNRTRPPLDDTVTEPEPGSP